MEVRHRGLPHLPVDWSMMPSGKVINWSKSELDYLIQNAHLGAYELSVNLGKPLNTVRDRAYILRISLKKGGKGSGRNLLPGAKRRVIPKPRKAHLVLDPFCQELLELYPNAIYKSRILWRRRRSIILKLHDNACYYCGDPADTVDHIKPRHLGGTDHRDNLVAACADCNYGWTQQIPWRDKYLKKRLQGA